MKWTLIALIALLAISCGTTSKESKTDENKLPERALGPFIRPEGVNPVISPRADTEFDCPMQGKPMKWEESDTFNPAAIVKDGKIVVLYRAEDNSAQGIGSRTSRVGYAESTDGVTMERRKEPVLYPGEDIAKNIEWTGGCEDPRVAVTEDGLYVIFYTGWNKDKARLAVATSRDLINWEKHGSIFEKAYDGRFRDTWSKASAILTEVKNDELVITKINGSYFMYWGEFETYAATSDDLINWTPVLDENNELKVIAKVRKGYFDSDLVECGPPAILTDKGIVLIYNGKNSTNPEIGDSRYPMGTYAAGQLLLDKNDPYKVLDRLDVPFFYPEADFEKSGQYKDGTVFTEGLVLYKGKYYMYYGCADSEVAVAVYDPAKK